MSYLPTSREESITIEVLAMPTSITLNAPSIAQPDVPFSVTGRLTFREGGIDYPLQGRMVSLDYNGTRVGDDTTDIYGDYGFTVTIPTEGTYILTASFAGEGLYGGSEIEQKTVIGAVAVPNWVMMLAPLLAGVAVVQVSK